MFKKIISWLHNLKSSHPTRSEGMHELAFRYGMDRRRHPRVSFPQSTSPELPRFIYQGKVFQIHDLSRGGVCLLDPDDEFRLEVGFEDESFWVEGDFREKLSLQLVGVSYQKKHLEFTRISPGLVDRIEAFIEPGIWGQKMHRSVLSPSAHLETSAVELWLGVNGSNLVFHSDPHFVASLLSPKASLNKNSKQLSVDFYRGSLPVYGASAPKQLKGKVLTPEDRLKALFFLLNFPVLSHRILNLIQEWQEFEKEKRERAG